MSALSRFWDQSFFIPKPSLTEQNLADQEGRVVLVTGGYAGVGYELSKILYHHNATVYVAGRDRAKGEKRIGEMKQAVPRSSGRLVFLHVDLSDMDSVKSAAEEFLKAEQRLDVLVNNAAVMSVPLGSTSKHGHELHFATNCLGPFLLTKLLRSVLESTAASSPRGQVRVIWAGSLGIDVGSPKDGGLDMESSGKPIPDAKQPQSTYAATKTGNLFLASQYAHRHPVDATNGKGVVTSAFNPGNLTTELGRHMPRVFLFLAQLLLTYPAKYGAYTELYAGWSEEMGRQEHNGGYVIPWGRVSDVRSEVQREVDRGLQGDEGSKATRFWDWCARETEAYV